MSTSLFLLAHFWTRWQLQPMRLWDADAFVVAVGMDAAAAVAGSALAAHDSTV